MTTVCLINYKLDLETNEELLKTSKENLGEDDDTRSQSIQEIKKLILHSECGSKYRTDDEFLLRFLRHRGFTVDNAYDALERYYRFKENHPNYYNKISFNRIMEISQLNLISIPPFLEKTGHRVIILRIGLWNPDEVTVEELFQSGLFLLEIACLEPRTQINGGICIFDTTDVGLRHAFHLTPSILSQCIEIIIHSYPIRLYAIHVINESTIFRMLFELVKPFLSVDHQSKFHFHGNNVSSLHEHVSQNDLPERFGGTHPDYTCDEWLSYVKTNKNILRELNSLGYLVN